MKKLFTDKELLNLGFVRLKDGEIDDDGFYEWWEYSISDICINITNKFEKEGKLTESYVEINGDKFPFMTKESVINLIKILRDGKAKD